MLGQVKEALRAGVAGMAMGRNVWQHRDAVALTRAIAQTVHGA